MFCQKHRRPLDVSARDAFLREVASAPASWPAIGDDVVHRVVAERQRDIFGHLNLAPEKPGSRVDGDSTETAVLYRHRLG